MPLPVRLGPVHFAQIMGDIARPDHENSFIAQRCQGRADVELMRGPQRGFDGNLRHRDIGPRIHQH